VGIEKKLFHEKNRTMLLDDDQVLIQRILEGDKSSFEELMKKYNRKMFNFILRMVREEEIAVELTQDFFIKIFTVLHKYNFQYKFSTWAYRICYNMVIDYVRKHQIFVDSLDNDAISPKQLVDSKNYVDEDGFDKLEREETREYIWKMVEVMPFKYKELILMRYMQGLKYDEIAQIANLPVGTVKNRIFKAKELLRKEIDKDGMFES
jgi:RNA polymerase sigma-70 factor (ECF subfamily)